MAAPALSKKAHASHARNPYARMYLGDIFAELRPDLAAKTIDELVERAIKQVIEYAEEPLPSDLWLD